MSAAHSTQRVPRKIRRGMLSDLARAATEAGWRIEVTRGGHAKWISPDGDVVFSGTSPSDHRTVRNHRSQLRRAGLDV